MADIVEQEIEVRIRLRSKSLERLDEERIAQVVRALFPVGDSERIVSGLTAFPVVLVAESIKTKERARG